MSGYESPSPDDEAAPSELSDIETSGGGDATGGGSPGDQDAMGADDGLTVDEGAGRTDSVEDDDIDVADLP